ncbi:hypothetical protein [Phaffia rhodozyma]|uniref:CFA20 domain-containing protein n=1 Tax=Phaffia rhodozyma TaxID=264483 RepID=A0A0F7SLJ8_PHARH|nr:hypothetical protein [Phaffia rhodozyma]
MPLLFPPSSLSSIPLISLFSSSTYPSPHWEARTDLALPEDSLIAPLKSDASSIPVTPLNPSCTLIHQPNGDRPGKQIVHPVIHLQSPTIRTTYLRCPAKSSGLDLGIGLEWAHLQLRPLGRRELAVEFGVVDGRGIKGIVRASTFTNEPHLSFSSTQPALLLLPLHLPPLPTSLISGSTSGTVPILTAWTHIIFHLPTLLSMFTSSLSAPSTSSSHTRTRPQAQHSHVQAPILPSGQNPRGSSWTYVKVYANCRLRRVWFSANRTGGTGLHGLKGEEEFGLFASEIDGEVEIEDHKDDDERREE